MIEKIELVTCPKCEGRGYYFVSQLSTDSRECDLCKGTGKVDSRLAKIEQDLQERCKISKIIIIAICNFF